jgi:hypothetical protein
MLYVGHEYAIGCWVRRVLLFLFTLYVGALDH